MMNYLFGYKILDNKKCGFPDNAINKVIIKLEELKIFYQIITTEEDPVVKDYRKLNKYKEYYQRSIKGDV